jgi:NAD(P)-dependent dehydrogenase (short-subunit alcohol dehydrogenase family)
MNDPRQPPALAARDAEAPTPTAQRVCLLTGASGRLGSVFLQTSAAEYRFVAVYHRRAPSSLPALKLLPPSALIEVQADLTCEAEQERVVALAMETYGRIDLLVNSAVHSVWSPMLEKDSRSVASAAAQFQLNVVVPLQLSVLCARKCWSGLRDENLARNRNIIQVSSLAGSKVFTNSGQGVYAASKAALDHLSRHMAFDFREIGIRVNAFAPNSFPRLLSTVTVVESMRKLDRGSMNGEVLVLDRAGERFV